MNAYLYSEEVGSAECVAHHSTQLKEKTEQGQNLTLLGCIL
jgi:hypothetical protein